MTRVTKPGRPVVILDTDWGTGSIDTSESKVERRITRILAERLLNNGYVGRQLYRLCKQQGLRNIEVDLFPNVATQYSVASGCWAGWMTRQPKPWQQGLYTSEELQRFRDGVEEADARPGSFSPA